MDVVIQKLMDIKRTPRDAVMFDIDDTLIRSSDNTIIEGAYNLLKFAKRIGYLIIIITARLPETRDYTEKQLQHYDIPYNNLFIVPPETKGQIKRQTGLRYVLSVGDMITDCTDSIYSLKLPGPWDQYGYFKSPPVVR